MERSATQPTRPGAASQPDSARGWLASRPGGLFGGGLLGGLAAGFLGAGLFGLLFGHGLFGGMSGLTSMLGLLLQVALVVLVARFLWAMWQRHRQPAVASGPMLRDVTPSGLGLGGGSVAGGGLRPATAAAQAGSDDVGIQPADYDAFERLLGEVQQAYAAEDVAALRTRATPEMVSYFAEELAANASRGLVNRLSGVRLLQGDLAESWREGDVEYATVAMRYEIVDQTVERASGRSVAGSDQPQEVTEVWTFQRARGGAWLVSAIQQT
jgi:predicted lipid-binding transport protein (Tim44 family)